jgi:hypothetical protein
MLALVLNRIRQVQAFLAAVLLISFRWPVKNAGPPHATRAPEIDAVSAPMAWPPFQIHSYIASKNEGFAARAKAIFTRQLPHVDGEEVIGKSLVSAAPKTQHI